MSEIQSEESRMITETLSQIINPLAREMGEVTTAVKSIDQRLQVLNGRVPALEARSAEQATMLNAHGIKIEMQAQLLENHTRVIDKVFAGLTAIQTQLAVSASASAASAAARQETNNRWVTHVLPVAKVGMNALVWVMGMAMLYFLLFVLLPHGPEIRKMLVK